MIRWRYSFSPAVRVGKLEYPRTEAAERLSRHWIGKDQSELAIQTIKEKLQLDKDDLFSQVRNCKIIDFQ